MIKIISHLPLLIKSGDSSDDDFESEEAAGGEEQQTMLKVLKFPEVESSSKIPNSCPKVAKCLQKRSKNLNELIGKYTDEKAPVLSGTQKALLCLIYS